MVVGEGIFCVGRGWVGVSGGILWIVGMGGVRLGGHLS